MKKTIRKLIKHLKPQEYIILSFIYLSSKTDRKSICQECNLSSTTAYEILKKLKEKGLIEISIEKTERNKKHIYQISEEGIKSFIERMEKDTEQSENIDKQGIEEKEQKKSERYIYNINNITKETKDNYVNEHESKIKNNKKSKKEKQIEDKKTVNCSSRSGEMLENRKGGEISKNFMIPDKEDYQNGAWRLKKVRWKLYCYRRFYQEYINYPFSRISKDAVLFILINTEKLVESGRITTDKVFNIILSVDKNEDIENPIGYLIWFFCITRGRFHFLLPKYENQNFEKKKETQTSVKVEKKVKATNENIVLLYGKPLPGDEEVSSFWKQADDSLKKEIYMWAKSQLTGLYLSDFEKSEALKSLIKERVREEIMVRKEMEQCQAHHQ